jgi:sirohydrochlorin cobaltochelatase
MTASALILFAHGARDPRWAGPFEAVLARVRAHAPERNAMLAFLELMSPDLEAAIDAQVARGHASIRIVPLFLGRGGHLRNDLPKLVDAARQRHPAIAIEVATPAGEADAVIEALADYCVANVVRST